MSDNDIHERLQRIEDRTQITDTLHRFAAGLDDGDADTFTSAFTDDAVVDFSPAGKIGIDFAVLAPRDVVVQSAMASVGPMDSSHAITNTRIIVTGDTARAHCYALAQHYRGGEGPNPRVTTHALMMNRYDVELVRSQSDWRIKRLTIDNTWFEGDTDVLRVIP
jgi:ketosteroid isomerase-like protein